MSAMEWVVSILGIAAGITGFALVLETFLGVTVDALRNLIGNQTDR